MRGLLPRMINAIDKNIVHFHREGKRIYIQFPTSDKAGNFCRLLNDIGDENYSKKIESSKGQ